MISFFRYFFNYILKSKTRQQLLLISVVGLVVSSMALFVLQAIMGGLQRNLIKRSKEVKGMAYAQIKHLDHNKQKKIFNELKGEFNFTPLIKLELLVKNEGFLAPAIIFGMHPEHIPSFLSKADQKGLILGSSLTQKIQGYRGDLINIISPAHVDSFLGDVPRQVSDDLSDIYYTDVEEANQFYIWTRSSLVQNLTRQKNFDSIYFFPKEGSSNYLAKIRYFAKENNLKLQTWEDKNSSLAWALRAESLVMLFLFISMSLLVGVAICSGYLIFLSRIKKDLASFWIMGMSKKKVLKLLSISMILTSFISILIGLGFGFALSLLIRKYAVYFMSDIFVDQHLPVYFSSFNIFSSFMIPFTIAFIFSMISLFLFIKEHKSFLPLVRSSSD